MHTDTPTPHTLMSQGLRVWPGHMARNTVGVNTQTLSLISTCHTVTAAEKGAPLAHQRGSCHHPPLWCCKGCGLPQALDNCLSYHQRAGATTLPLVTSNTEWCLYFFLKREHLTVSSSEAASQQWTAFQDHSTTHTMAAPHAQDPGAGWEKGATLILRRVPQVPSPRQGSDSATQ